MSTTEPWDWVWEQAVKDAAFWKEEIEEPTFLVLTHTKSLGSMLGDDTSVASSTATGTSSSRKRGAEQIPPPPPKQSPQKSTKQRQYSIGADGLYLANFSGTLLCAEFQTGACRAGAKGTRCRADSSKAHQCKKCLSPDHGADACGKGMPPKRDPKGCGKGKRKGGKGRW